MGLDLSLPLGCCNFVVVWWFRVGYFGDLDGMPWVGWVGLSGWFVVWGLGFVGWVFRFGVFGLVCGLVFDCFVFVLNFGWGG